MIHHHSSGKRRLWKRIFSMCIALILICGMTVPASSVSASSITDGVSEEAVTPDGKTALNETASGETETVSGTTEMEASESKTDDSATQPDKTTPEGTDGSETDNSETNDSETNDSGETVPTATVTYTFYVDGEVYNTQTLKDGETLTAPADPEADGKTFDGWYTAETDGEKFTAFGVQTVTETKTVDLYAGWLTDAGSESDDTPESTEEIPGEEVGTAGDGVEADGETAQSSEDVNGGISTMSISGPEEVEIGDTIELTSNRGRYHRWSANNNNVFLTNTNETTVLVRGVSAGTTTITHQYSNSIFGRWQSETYTVTVTAASSSGSYNLYAYTLIPGRQEGDSDKADDIWNGMGVGSISGVPSPDSLTVNTIVDDGYENGYGNYNGAEIVYPDEAEYSHSLVTGGITQNNIPSYPPIYSDGTWYYYAETGSENAYREGYYTIEWMRVIVANGANAGNNQYNTTIADRESGGQYTYHLDGVVTLNEKDIYTVQFRLQDAGSNSFALVDPVTYSTRVEKGYQVSNLNRPDTYEPDKYPATKTEGGITYTFDGWYYDEDCTQKVDWGQDTIEKNTTFYGRYVPATQNITVTKDVTGNFGDTQKEFSFTYSYSAGGSTVEGKIFSLKDKDMNTDSQYVISNVPVGAVLTITETDAEGYMTTATYGGTAEVVDGDTEDREKTLTVTVESGKENIVIINHKDAIPDTGVKLTSLPYVCALILSLSGTVAYITYRYKRRRF